MVIFCAEFPNQLPFGSHCWQIHDKMNTERNETRLQGQVTPILVFKPSSIIISNEKLALFFNLYCKNK